MKNWFQQIAMGFGLSGLVLLGGGCRSGLTTSLVWRIHEYHPAATPRLQLATVPGTNDVLVRYDECFAKSTNSRPRAYWLFAYAVHDTNRLNRPKPNFVPPESFTNACPIPQLATENAVPAQSDWVMVRSFPTVPTQAGVFKLWRNGTYAGQYELPVYSGAPPVTWGRVLLTPVTVATDAAIVAAACMAAGGYGAR
jgi:hypothetical protein